MYYNPFIFISMPLTILLYFIGYKIAKILKEKSHKRIAFISMLLLCIPGLILVIENIATLLRWNISKELTMLLSIEGSELLSSLLALPIAYLLTLKPSPEKIRWNIFSKYIVFLLIMNVLSLYMDPILFAAETKKKPQERWYKDMCYQTTDYTCSPAALATILRYYGVHATEEELARGCYTSWRGTLPYYLIRCARKYGLECEIYSNVKPEEIKTPSIITLKYAGEILHSAAALQNENEHILLADPMNGRYICTYQQIMKRYFTGDVIYFIKKENHYTADGHKP